MFDRSGPYNSGEFDMHEEPERFIGTNAAYVMMNDEELGLDISRSGKVARISQPSLKMRPATRED